MTRRTCLDTCCRDCQSEDGCRNQCFAKKCETVKESKGPHGGIKCNVCKAFVGKERKKGKP